MRRVPSVVLVLALLGSAPVLAGCGSDTGAKASTTRTTADPTAGFVTLAGEGFTVKLPTTTTRMVRDVPTKAGTVKAVIYSTTDDPAGTFALALTPYPPGVLVDLDKAVAGAAKNIGATVRDKTTGRYRGHETRDARFTATISGTKFTFFVRVIDLNGKLFQLQFAKQGADIAHPPAAYETVAATVRFG